MSEVTVHTWEPNSNSGKPLFALAEKGVPFDHAYIDIVKFEQHMPDYLALNPAGTVPTMVHGDRIFVESTPMCEYVDAAFSGPKLVPDDPASRYKMREWGRRTDMAAAALSVLGWHMFLGPMVRAMDPEELERLIARIPTKERRIAWSTAAHATFTDQQLDDARVRVGAYVMELDAQLAKTPWLVGDDYTLADTVTFANFYALPMTVPDYANREKAPHYVDWLTRIYARPATLDLFRTSRSLGQRALEIAADLGSRDMIALHYDAPTPDAVKLIVALGAAGLEFETVPVDTSAYAQWEAPHRALALQGQIPVLVDGDLAMPEAAFALQYIGEAHAPALVPANPWLWYEVQALNQQIDGAIGPAVNLLGWTRDTNVEERAAHRSRLAAIPHRQKPAGWHAVWADAEANEDQLANAREKIEGGLDQLEARLDGADWLVGGALSIADINAFALVRAVRAVMAESIAERPALARWLAQMESRAPLLEEVAFPAPA